MPWKDVTVETQRQSVCYRIVHQKEPVARVCRDAGISRKTAYKWLGRYRADPLAALVDRSRRPVSSPRRTDPAVEAQVLAIRDRHRWGGRKIQRLLQEAALSDAVSDAGLNAGLDESSSVRSTCPPSIRTVSAILKRSGRTAVPSATSEPVAAPIFFERGRANQLWQFDHQGPREIARVRHLGFTIIDDHSRFCFCFEPLTDTSIHQYWPVLWRIFQQHGLPESILCDNAFGARGEARGRGVSELEMRLIRLGIRPIHGRPYHPQTQGKVERLHGTIDRELIRFNARLDRMDQFLEDRDRWLRTYNYLRPHESLGDRPPISRFVPSLRACPANLPTIEYDQGQLLRKVSQVGDIHYHRVRIGLSRSLAGQFVRIEEQPNGIGVYYAWKQLRTLTHEQLSDRNKNQWT